MFCSSLDDSRSPEPTVLSYYKIIAFHSFSASNNNATWHSASQVSLCMARRDSIPFRAQ